MDIGKRFFEKFLWPFDLISQIPGQIMCQRLLQPTRRSGGGRRAFGEMSVLRIIVTLVSGVAFTGTLLAADPPTSPAERLLGRWESTSFVATNFDLFSGTETNLILCVFEVEQQWTNPATGKYEAQLDVELRSKDRGGQERLVSDSFGSALMQNLYILFGGLGGFGFSYSLTNGVLRFEKSARFTITVLSTRSACRLTLKKVSTKPGERLLKWRAESPAPDGGPATQVDNTNIPWGRHR